MQQTSNYGLNKPEQTDVIDIDNLNTNFDKLDTELKKVSDKANYIQTAGGTGTAITLTNVNLVKGFTITFVVAANNSGVATTINGKSLYKPNTTIAPTLATGKAVTVWYDTTGGCFFFKASAEGDAVAANVLAGKIFSNDVDTGLTGTMPNNGTVTQSLPINGTYTIPAGYHSGSGSVTQSIATKAATTYSPSTSAQSIAAGQYLSGAQTIAAITGTAGTGAVLSGYTFNSAAGIGLTGTMSNNGTVAPGALGAGGSYTIPAGYHNGSGVVSAATLASQTSATATAAQILSGQTAWVGGSRLTGTMANNGAVTPLLGAGGIYTIPAGYHNGSGKVTGVSLSDQTPATATAVQILSGQTAYVNGVKLTGTMPNRTGAYQAAVQYDGTYTAQRLYMKPPAGYYDGTDPYGYVYADDPDFVSSKILSGANIFGLTGTAKRTVKGSVQNGSIRFNTLTPGFNPSVVNVWYHDYDLNGKTHFANIVYDAALSPNQISYLVYSWCEGDYWSASTTAGGYVPHMGAIALDGSYTFVNTSGICLPIPPGFMRQTNSTYSAYSYKYSIEE